MSENAIRLIVALCTLVLLLFGYAVCSGNNWFADDEESPVDLTRLARRNQ